LRHIDPARKYILVDYSADHAVNNLMLSAHSVTFGVARGTDRIDFIAANPVDATFDGVRCLRFDHPNTMMLNRRRSQVRAAVVPMVPLHCVADTGGILSFECDVVDISGGGLGTMIYDNAILLQPGTFLKECRIFCGSETIDIDMEVRYSVATTLANGSGAQRAGFRFCGTEAKLDELLHIFALKNESPAGGAKP